MVHKRLQLTLQNCGLIRHCKSHRYSWFKHILFTEKYIEIHKQWKRLSVAKMRQCLLPQITDILARVLNLLIYKQKNLCKGSTQVLESNATILFIINTHSWAYFGDIHTLSNHGEGNSKANNDPAYQLQQTMVI